MADFSLTTLFVVPVGQTALPSSGSTQDLTPGQVGVFREDYTLATAGNIAAAKYFYVAQGRGNTYLQGSKRSDKIKGCAAGAGCNSNVTEWYKVAGCATAANQITQIGDWNIGCGEEITVTIRAFSNHLDMLYFNGLTRSVTVTAPCCECGADPCEIVDVEVMADLILAKLNAVYPYNNGINPDNTSLRTYFTFSKVGTGAATKIQIEGKPLTKYGLPCDVAAYPFEMDRMYFRTYITPGPATTADFLVDDACDVAGKATIIQRASYPAGTSDEITQMEKNYYSYQAGYLKHLYRMIGYNQNFESYVSAGAIYDTFYVKFNEVDKSAYQWGDYIEIDATVAIAVIQGSAVATELQTLLEAALGVLPEDQACETTTTTTTVAPPLTTTTSTIVIP